MQRNSSNDKNGRPDWNHDDDLLKYFGYFLAPGSPCDSTYAMGYSADFLGLFEKTEESQNWQFCFPQRK